MATKKRKFADGGGIEYMSPEDVKEAKMRKRATAAYDKAMPEPDTTFGKLRSSTDKARGTGRYASVRPEGFEEGVSRAKDAALAEGVRGAGNTLKGIAKSAANLPAPGLGAALGGPDDMAKGTDQMRSAYKAYRRASDSEDAAERELSAQNKRESRMASGGKVSSASRRGDGIAMRGKTRGKMI